MEYPAELVKRGRPFDVCYLVVRLSDNRVMALFHLYDDALVYVYGRQGHLLVPHQYVDVPAWAPGSVYEFPA